MVIKYSSFWFESDRNLIFYNILILYFTHKFIAVSAIKSYLIAFDFTKHVENVRIVKFDM